MSEIVIDDKRCKGCGLCTIACPKKLIRLSDTLNRYGVAMAVFSGPGSCSGCALCAQMCPDVAILVYKE